MSRYLKGQTSEAKTHEKEQKSQSLLTKVLLIKKANTDSQRIESLDAIARGRGVSFKAALGWVDEALNIAPCAYNTSQKPYNIELSNSLKIQLQIYNSTTKAQAAASEKRPAKSVSVHQRLADMRQECEHLKNAVAEIYRAYMQLQARVDDKTRQDIRYQQVLKNHARALGKAKLIVVKP